MRILFTILSLMLASDRLGAQTRRAPTPADWEYVGKMPLYYSKTCPDGLQYLLDNARGLAVQVEGSTVKVIVAAPRSGQIQPQWIFRFTMPASFNGSMTLSECLGSPGPVPGNTVYGLRWEDPNLLYYNTQSEYDADPVQQKTLCRSVWNSTAFVSDNCWNLLKPDGTPIGDKQTQGGTARIPQWFANARAPGKTIGVGWGFYFSSAINGQASKGASLWAIPPPATTSATVTAGPRLLGNDFTNKDPARWWRRPGDYIRGCDPTAPIPGIEKATDAPCVTANTVFAGDLNPDPVTGLGWTVWTDWAWQGFDWVDDEPLSITGLVGVVTQCFGRTYYKDATLKCEHARHMWAIVDANDLGVKAADAIQPVWTPVEFPGVTYPLSAWRDYPSKMVLGVTWAPALRMIFVHVRQSSTVVVQGANKAVGTIYAFRLKTGVSPPGAVSNVTLSN